MLIPFLESSVVLNLTATHLTALFSGCKWKEKGFIGYPVLVIAGKKIRIISESLPSRLVHLSIFNARPAKKTNNLYKQTQRMRSFSKHFSHSTCCLEYKALLLYMFH